MKNGMQLKVEGIEATINHNPEITKQVVIFLEQARICRLRRAERWDEVFTVADLIAQFEVGFGRQVPHQLAGAIGRMARQRGVIEETNQWVASKRDARHCNRVPLCRWKLY